jgi:hypothetical protein
MSNSTKGRIQRGPAPAILTDSNYRKYALPALERDFDNRCAYSMQHRRRAGGSRMLMEIDHFDPTIRGRERHRYANLFLASHYCNNKNLGNWPFPDAIAKGVRFLNCCEEQDYGEHIFENPTIHLVVGVTPPGKYNVRMLYLNAPHLVQERAERSMLRKLLYVDRKRVKETDPAMLAFNILQKELDYLIPVIEPLRDSGEPHTNS